MELFDFITQDEIDDLPHDDPRSAFVTFTRIAHRRLGERMKELSGDNNDQWSWEQIRYAQLSFMSIVIAAAKKYEIDPFASMDVPKRKDFDAEYYEQLRADLDHFLTQLALDNSSRSRRGSVPVTPELKASVRTYVHHLRDLIEKAEGFDPSKRATLLRRLKDFEDALEKKRLNLLELSLLAIAFTGAPGGFLASVEAANKLVYQIIKVVGEAKAVDDATRRLPPAEEPLAISPPRPPEPPEPASRRSPAVARHSDMDDEIPF